MDSTYRLSRSTPLTAPLMVSIVATSVVAALVCTPPSQIHSWHKLASLATLYLCVAACVHACTVWTIFKITDENTRDDVGTSVFPLIWGAWIAVVWLPLLALLTAEHSAWVCAVLPIVAFFSTLLVVWCSAVTWDDAPTAQLAASEESLFAYRSDASFWPGFFKMFAVALGINGGVAALAAGHAWIAGCLLAVATVYVTHRLADAYLHRLDTVSSPTLTASLGNTVAVWLLMSVALLPFLVGFGSNLLGLLAMSAAGSAKVVPAHQAGNHYTSMILYQPQKPHAHFLPHKESATGGVSKPKDIPFDGAYWYFQLPDTHPTANAHITHGDPITAGIRATNKIPLAMEAHQPLRESVSMNCCRSLRVNIINGDAVPGSIALEALLTDSAAKTQSSVSLGTRVLTSSTVSPMPLNRAPVHEALTFTIPRSNKGRSFDEIAIRIKPETLRSLAGAKVKIDSFALLP